MADLDAPRPDEPLLVVVPAYNEESVIGSVVSELNALGYAVVVVDDGSRDATSAAALAAGATVLRHIYNLGQGAALQTGIAFALKEGAATIVTFDADGQHDPADIAVLRDAAQTSGCEVVLGSRFLGSAIGISKSRTMLLRLASLFTRLSTGLQLSDTHNGIRLLRRSAASRIAIHHNGMAHASEILRQIKEHGLTYREAPVTIRYSEHSIAKGQKNTAAMGILLDLFMGLFPRRR